MCNKLATAFHHLARRLLFWLFIEPGLGRRTDYQVIQGVSVLHRFWATMF